MAATGLPTPRDDHAVVMCKFARAALVKMSQIMHELQSKLGRNTVDLAMRFGVHSGPVTAGVLRGVKSRFQVRTLFILITEQFFICFDFFLINLSLSCSCLAIL